MIKEDYYMKFNKKFIIAMLYAIPIGAISTLTVIPFASHADYSSPSTIILLTFIFIFLTFGAFLICYEIMKDTEECKKYIKSEIKVSKKRKQLNNIRMLFNIFYLFPKVNYFYRFKYIPSKKCYETDKILNILKKHQCTIFAKRLKNRKIQLLIKNKHEKIVYKDYISDYSNFCGMFKPIQQINSR